MPPQPQNEDELGNSGAPIRSSALLTRMYSRVKTTAAEAYPGRPGHSRIRSTSAPATYRRDNISTASPNVSDVVDQTSLVVEVGSCEDSVLAHASSEPGARLTTHPAVTRDGNQSGGGNETDLTWALSRKLFPFLYEDMPGDMSRRGGEYQSDAALSPSFQELLIALDGSHLETAGPGDTVARFVGSRSQGKG